MNEQDKQAFESFVKSQGGDVMKRYGCYNSSMTLLYMAAWQAALEYARGKPRTIETALGTAKVLSEGKQEPVAPDPFRDCPHGRQKGKCPECDVLHLEAKVKEIEQAAEQMADALRSVLGWDMGRKYIVPYRVRDPIRDALANWAQRNKEQA